MAVRVGARVRARLRREVRVYGLRSPARVGHDGRIGWVEADAADRDCAEGLLAAVSGFAAFDLQRRLLAGRLSEVLGPLRVGGFDLGTLDLFVRFLGLDRRLPRVEGVLADRLDAYARGVNAAIDAGQAGRGEEWRRLGSRPRLWAPIDSLRIAALPGLLDRSGLPTRVEARMSATDGLGVSGDPGGGAMLAAGSPPQAEVDRLTSLGNSIFLALRSPALRAPNGPAAGLRWVVDRGEGPTETQGGVPSGFAVAIPGPFVRLEPIVVMPGEDGHRFEDSSARGGFRRLSVRKAEVSVRGEGRRWCWARQAPAGPLLSDFGKQGAPLVGAAWALASGGVTARPAGPPTTEPLLRLPPLPRRVPTLRLVPLRDGA
jgi:hypothetical protein